MSANWWRVAACFVVAGIVKEIAMANTGKKMGRTAVGKGAAIITAIIICGLGLSTLLEELR
jgi:putative Mn2+ efflux pump MntP